MKDAELKVDKSGAIVFINFVKKYRDLARKFHRAWHPFPRRRRWKPLEHARKFAGAFPAFGSDAFMKFDEGTVMNRFADCVTGNWGQSQTSN